MDDKTKKKPKRDPDPAAIARVVLRKREKPARSSISIGDAIAMTKRRPKTP
jgi:hypothetical protein